MKKTCYIISIILLLLVVTLSSCNAKRKPAPKPAPQERMTPAPKQQQTREEPKAHNEAKRLSTAAEKVQGVKKATVVISENTAFVGLETDANIEKSKTKDIKEKVSKEIKKTNNKIKTVNITTDPNIIKRIEKVAKGIEEGKPVSSFAEELAEITRRITPNKE